jgi:hypothetical protein
MKWYTPLIIVGSFLLLFAFFGEPGTPELSYGTAVTVAETDPTNLTLTYTVAMTVKNTGTAAADNTIVTVYLKTPPGAPEWQQNDILFPVGRLAKGELTTRVDTTTLTVGEETYLFLTSGVLPETTVVATYSDAFF